MKKSQWKYLQPLITYNEHYVFYEKLVTYRLQLSIAVNSIINGTAINEIMYANEKFKNDNEANTRQ